MPSTDRTIHLDSPEEGRLLRQFFQECGYNMQSLEPVLSGKLPLMLHNTREPSRMHTLLRWLFIGRAVEEKTASRFIPGEVLQLLLKSGLLVREQNQLVPVVRLVPFRDVLTACDHAVAPDEEPPRDLVIGPNAPAGRLLQISVRRKVGAALDLCCGGGVHALQLAGHSDTVVASDLNPRAVALARFNARLHGAENIEFVEGDGFGPVAGRRFDLIVANPPFYVLPGTEFLYRDNPIELDGFVRELARQAPGYLNEGGFFQMFLEWVEIEGQPWHERLAEWLAESGCDVWVLPNYVFEPLEYCEERLRMGGPAQLERDLANVARWTAYYDRHKVAAVHGGVLTMRKRSGAKNWIEMEGTSSVQGEASNAVESFFSAQDIALTAGTETLLALRPRLSPHARLEQISPAAAAGWGTPSMQLSTSQGVLRTCPLDGQVAAFLSHLDGKRTLRDLLEFLPPEQGANGDQANSACLAVMRLLIRRGFVLPGD
jgi:SAM-dependent methyltransferase